MILNVYKKLSPVLVHGFSSARRLQQTAMAIGITGVSWVLDDRPAAPVMMRQAFERLGATYIKLGQLIASSP